MHPLGVLDNHPFVDISSGANSDNMIYYKVLWNEIVFGYTNYLFIFPGKPDWNPSESFKKGTCK